ncbi:MAG: MATE family efflux transporter [Alphaproteobacteria bacterium]|nr:MATE family efflux transporter [Alphaproteobacteria bacterium]
MSNKKELDLGQDSLTKLLVSFAWPAISGLLIVASYNFIDRIFVGQGVGSLGLAGIAVSFPGAVIRMALAQMMGVGANVNFSVSLGQRKYAKAEHILTNAFMTAVYLALILITLHYIFMDPLLRLYGANDEILPYARTYTSIILVSTVFFISSLALNNVIRACGYPKTSMFTMAIGAVINIILDYIFIFWCHWGLAGAAWATAISEICSFIWTFTFFVCNRCKYKMRWKYVKLNYYFVLAIVSVGLSPCLMQLCNGFVQVIFNTLLVKYGGSLAVSAMGVSFATVMLFFMPLLGIGEGGQPILGFNLGAKKYKRLMKLFRIMLLYGSIWSCIAWCIVNGFSQQIIKVFTQNDENLIRVGSQALRYIGLAFPLIGIQVVIVYFLQATKNPRKAVFLSLTRQLIFLIPTTLILSKHFGLLGIFWSLPTSDTLSALVAIPFYFIEKNKYKKLQLENQEIE